MTVVSGFSLMGNELETIIPTDIIGSVPVWMTFGTTNNYIVVVRTVNGNNVHQTTLTIYNKETLVKVKDHTIDFAIPYIKTFGDRIILYSDSPHNGLTQGYMIYDEKLNLIVDRLRSLIVLGVLVNESDIYIKSGNHGGQNHKLERYTLNGGLLASYEMGYGSSHLIDMTTDEERIYFISGNGSTVLSLNKLTLTDLKTFRRSSQTSSYIQRQIHSLGDYIYVNLQYSGGLLQHERYSKLTLESLSTASSVIFGRGKNELYTCMDIRDVGLNADSKINKSVVSTDENMNVKRFSMFSGNQSAGGHFDYNQGIEYPTLYVRELNGSEAAIRLVDMGGVLE